jgi:hypothetical protein
MTDAHDLRVDVLDQDIVVTLPGTTYEVTTSRQIPCPLRGTDDLQVAQDQEVAM